MAEIDYDQVVATVRDNPPMTLTELVAAVPGLHFASVAWLIQKNLLTINEDDRITVPSEPGTPQYLQWMRRTAKAAMAAAEAGATTDPLTEQAVGLCRTMLDSNRSNIEIDKAVDTLIAACDGQPKFALIYLAEMLSAATVTNTRLREAKGK